MWTQDLKLPLTDLLPLLQARFPDLSEDLNIYLARYCDLFRHIRTLLGHVWAHLILAHVSINVTYQLTNIALNPTFPLSLRLLCTHHTQLNVVASAQLRASEGPCELRCPHSPLCAVLVELELRVRSAQHIHFIQQGFQSSQGKSMCMLYLQIHWDIVSQIKTT